MVDIPVNGRLSALIDFGKVLKDKRHFADNPGDYIKDVSFAIEGGRGKIGFGDSEDFDYDVSSFNLEGQLHGGLDKVKIENAAFDFDGKKAELSLSASGFKDYFFKGNLENFKVNFRAKVGAFEMDELSLLWPRYLGEKRGRGARKACTAGALPTATFRSTSAGIKSGAFRAAEACGQSGVCGREPALSGRDAGYPQRVRNRVV